MPELTTKGRITKLLGKYQLTTGQRLTPRRLAHLAGVPKDLVYRLDAGQARYVELDALARLCQVLDCRVDEILIWENPTNGASNAEFNQSV
ncbi:MAG: helix-turn-helix transcriptional regulator [Anaerolineales bacterium]|nr:helix-turn-helix transcriptional regulator [Anaerolineales bacterium]